MANKNSEQRDPAADRRDPVHEGSSLSGSTKRENDSTDKALHPHQSRADQKQNEHTGRAESGVIARNQDPEDEIVDQDPGEAQRRNQAEDKDDPLAA